MNKEEFSDIIWKVRNKRKLTPNEIILIRDADEVFKMVVVNLFNELIK